nr:cyclin-dependent kinase 2-associated protein 2-like isoform X2 [Lytechinus pictus]
MYHHYPFSLYPPQDQLELLDLQQQHHHQQQQQHLHHQQQQQSGAQHFMTEIDKKPVILVVPSIPGPSSSSSSTYSSKMAATPMNVSSAGAGAGRILSGQPMHMGGGSGSGGGGNPQMMPGQEIPTNLMVKQGHSSSAQPAFAGGPLNAAAVIQQLQQQRPTAPQSKYAELLAVIEDMGRDIRPTYAGSRTATERLRRGITHAKALVRECLAETERSART